MTGEDVDQDLLPPAELRGSVGEGDFAQVGRQFLRIFIEQAGLQPHHRVLDVGCGAGRMALPLTNYLTEEGGYEGFDVMKPAIEWCQENITPRFNNFRFLHADVSNRAYNPGGTLVAGAFTFPYESRSFDFVCLASVFTHMLPTDAERYLGEVARVLKPPGGGVLATYFLLNPEAEELLASGKANLPYKEWAVVTPEYRTVSAEVPETAVCYEEMWVKDLYRRHDLLIEEPIRYGAWPGRSEFLDFQDIVVARKPLTPPHRETRPGVLRRIGRWLRRG